MENYPQDIIELYTNKKISKEEFIKQFSEWQKRNGIDYSFNKTVDNSGVYFTYRNITATIKNDKLHFKTYQNDTAKTPFEFRRKVDFYLEQREREIDNAILMAGFYFCKAIKAKNSSETNDYQTNIEKARYWAEIAKERMTWL